MNRKKMLSITAGFALVIAGAVTPVHAQSNALTARIPFAFTVSGATLPAGEYRFSPLSQNAWEIRNELGKPAAATAARPDGVNENDSSAKVMFKHCGGKYFLAGMIALGEKTAVPASKAERELEREMASTSSQVETLYVVASLR